MRASAIIAVAGFVVALSVSCGTRHPFEDPTTSTNGADADAGVFAPGDPSISDCGLHCSSDLHSVVNCKNILYASCPADQGCGAGGKCVPACDAAKANKSTFGCDYYSVDPDIIQEAHGACYAAYVVNTWSKPITITVERGGQTLDTSTFARIPAGSGRNITYQPLPGDQLPPGQAAILFLAGYTDPASTTQVPCPAGVTPAYVAPDGAAKGTALGEAFHIATSAPVSAYDILPYGGGQSAITSATLLLPTSAWDTNYLAVNAYSKSVRAPQAQPSLDIVAAESDTHVTINPLVDIVGAGALPGSPKGVSRTFTLAKGQVLQLTQDEEMTGSPIQSDKPIAVWGGANCMNVSPTTCCCDAAHQQLIPVKALGNEYVAVRYRNRVDGIEESPPWRIVGTVDGTQLSYDPAPPPGALGLVQNGQVIEFKAAGPLIVRSQDKNHPFHFFGYMTGCESISESTDCRGDPEFVNVVAPQQFLDSYVFFTDPTYPETNLVVVRNKGPSGFADVTLDCAGALTGWAPIGSSGEHEYTRIDLVRHNFEKQGNCDNGRHEMKSALPFGLTVWGWGSAETGGTLGHPEASGFYTQCVSYAYPGGMSVLPINTVIVPAGPK